MKTPRSVMSDYPGNSRRPLNSRWGFRHRGLMGGVLMAFAVALTLLSTPIIREGTWADSAVDLVAWFVFVAGGVFRFWSTLYVGGYKRTTLVAEGPYSLCRNPLYVGSFLLALSTGLYLKSLTFAAFLGLAVLAYMFLTVRAEEEDLREIHGEVYEEYCRRVPRFFPRISNFQTPPIIELRLHGLRIETKRALLWFCIPWIGEALSHLRFSNWWPHLFSLF